MWCACNSSGYSQLHWNGTVRIRSGDVHWQVMWLTVNPTCMCETSNTYYLYSMPNELYSTMDCEHKVLVSRNAHFTCEILITFGIVDTIVEAVCEQLPVPLLWARLLLWCTVGSPPQSPHHDCLTYPFDRLVYEVHKETDLWDIHHDDSEPQYIRGVVSLHQADALDQYFLVKSTHTLHVLMEKLCFINTAMHVSSCIVVKFAEDFCCCSYMLLDIDFCYPYS